MRYLKFVFTTLIVLLIISTSTLAQTVPTSSTSTSETTTSTDANAMTNTTTAQTSTISTAITTMTQLQEQIRLLEQRINELRMRLPLNQSTTSPAFIFTSTLHIGMSGEEVSRLQEFLAQDREVYPEALVTGFFGPLTERAVMRFQAKNGIESLGVVGPITRARLNALMQSTLTLPTSTSTVTSTTSTTYNLKF